jgi:hypothetical protein
LFELVVVRWSFGDAEQPMARISPAHSLAATPRSNLTNNRCNTTPRTKATKIMVHLPETMASVRQPASGRDLAAIPCPREGSALPHKSLRTATVAHSLHTVSPPGNTI